MRIETISLIIAAFVSGSLGIATLIRNYRSRLCIIFAGLTGLLFIHDFLGVLESFDSGGGLSSPRLHVLCMLCLGPMALTCLKELVPAYKSSLNKVLWAYAPFILVLLIVMRTPLYSRASLSLYVFSHVLFLIPAGIWLVTLHKAEQNATLTRERLRFRYAFWGGVVALAFFVTNAAQFAGAHVPPLGTLARVLYLIFLFQTFIQKELMTSDEVVTKVALFGLISLMLSAIYSLLVAWVGDRTDLFFFNTFIASFVIIVLFDPIRNLTTHFTRRLFLRRNLMLEEELNSLSQDVMGILEPAELSRRIRMALRKSLGTESCSLFLRDRDGLSYVHVGSAETSPIPEISSSNPLVEYMTLRRGRPFVLETIESDRDSFRASQPRRFCQTCLEAMRNLKIDFVIPFVNDSQVVGFCAVRTGERIALSNEQLKLFIPLSRQIASLLKNAQTFSYLRDRDKLAAVGEMAAGLAHEIKNPLGAIKGAAELLKGSMREGDRETTQFLKIILDETDRLSGVLTDFLDYAKPRRNYPQLSCDPLRVIEHTASLCLHDSKISFEVESSREGLTIEADPEVLKQVLLNLFLNAVQAMEGFTEKPKLKVTVREIRPNRLLAFAEPLPLFKIWEGWEALTESTSKSFIEIEVSDNGPGIRKEEMSQLFIPFFTTKPKGTGLGLAICQRLVESMGGSIQVKPNRPNGSIFTIHLPIRREESRESTIEVFGAKPILREHPI